jgi:exodeoxyribonuclease V alpha subunit
MSRGVDVAERLLAAGFAAQIEAFAGAAQAPAAAVRAARAAAHALSLATSAGQVCLPLAALPAAPGLPGDASAWRDALLRSAVVGTDDAPGAMPLVLDGDDRLYLHRYFDHERRLAERVRRALRAAPTPAAHAPVAAVAPLDWQRIAVALALRGRFTVISGGPGTGKTTTVAAILAGAIGRQSDSRIALAAPTGKAAARLADAIAERAEALSAGVRERLPKRAQTVHRLLGVNPATGRVAHDRDRPLPIDLLVVDEASMLDLALARRLFDAVPDAARIVLLGDKDQLAAVEAGAVFGELAADPTLSAACVAELAAATGIPAEAIVPPTPATPGGLRDAVVWLARNWRFEADSGIGRLAAAINAGDGAALVSWLRSQADPSVEWLDDGGVMPGAATTARIADGYAAYVEAVRRHADDPAAVASAFDRFRVLCAVRDGPRGVAAVNAIVEQRLRGDARGAWYAGRPVLVLRNDATLRLANGDVGIALPDASGAGAGCDLRVGAVPARWRCRVYAPSQRPVGVICALRRPRLRVSEFLTTRRGSGVKSLILLDGPLLALSRQRCFGARVPREKTTCVS